jgi:hypothetical protein
LQRLGICGRHPFTEIAGPAKQGSNLKLATFQGTQTPIRGLAFKVPQFMIMQ